MTIGSRNGQGCVYGTAYVYGSLTYGKSANAPSSSRLYRAGMLISTGAMLLVTMIWDATGEPAEKHSSSR